MTTWFALIAGLACGLWGAYLLVGEGLSVEVSLLIGCLFWDLAMRTFLRFFGDEP